MARMPHRHLVVGSRDENCLDAAFVAAFAEKLAWLLVEPDQSIPFLCECIDETCMARIELTPKEYEMARSDDEWFVIARGHPLLDGERIVEEEEHYLIVTKENVG